MGKKLFALLFTFVLAVSVQAQIKGIVTDQETGDPMPGVRIAYTSNSAKSVTNVNGKYTIARVEGDVLVFSIVGYDDYKVTVDEDTPDELNIVISPKAVEMKTTIVDAKSLKYSRKNNPAVDLMRRIIQANKKNNLKSNDFYEFYRYQKTTFARNNVKQEYIDSLKAAGSKEWMTDQVERCPLNNKLILPMQTNETVMRTIYRKSSDDERSIILGENQNGLMSQLSSLGEMFNSALKLCFVDVDIYEDQIKLLQQGFTSPIGKDAIQFYHFYINDTTYVGSDLCYDLYFAPNNHQDVGFSGHVYALADSSLHIRRVELSLPKETGVNFIQHMSLVQEFVQLPDGQWVLDADDMIAEMNVNKLLKNMAVIRRTKYSNYSFADIPKTEFHGNSVTKTVPEATYRSKDFWAKFRTLELTESEKKVNKFANSMMNRKGWKWLFVAIKTYSDDYIKTSYKDSVPSKFDFGPLTTLIGKNYVDGWHTRISARTKPALNHHWFWRGYIAYGFGPNQHPKTDGKRIYYSTDLTYSFNRKEKQPWEFPIRQIKVTSTYDVISPYDKYLTTNKDNWLTLIHVRPQHLYFLTNRQNIEFQYELAGGFCITAGLKAEGIQGVGDLKFLKTDSTAWAGDNKKYGEVRTTELSVSLRYAPGETYLNTNLRRYPLTQNAPVFYFNQVIGLKNVLGADYNTNYSEISVTKRFWLRSWGKMDFYVAGKAQWSKVPMPLLIMPTTNLCWITMHETHTFELMNNMEFLSDRTAQWQFMWDMNGKLFNRIPLIKKLKWREVIIFRGMWSHLTDKNNPSLHPDDPDLMLFPQLVDKKHVCYGTQMYDTGRLPYMELSFGIHNIFKLFEIDYVRRMTFRNNAHAMKWGIRLGLNFAF